MTNIEQSERLRLLVTSLGFEALLQRGWRIELGRGNRGYCHWNTRLITIPQWVFDLGCAQNLLARKKLSVMLAARYAEYYICHEVAHAIAGSKAAHGQKFMAAFIKICPPELAQCELGYKPRNAAAAGIRRI